jgi:hypothetical protein
MRAGYDQSRSDDDATLDNNRSLVVHCANGRWLRDGDADESAESGKRGNRVASDDDAHKYANLFGNGANAHTTTFTHVNLHARAITHH